MSEFKYDIESDMFTCYFLYNKKLYFLLCKKDCTDKKNRVKSKIFIDRRKRRRYYKVNTETELEDRNYEI